MVRKLALAWFVVFLAGSPLAAQEWAKKMFPVTEHDFGTVARTPRRNTISFFPTSIWSPSTSRMPGSVVPAPVWRSCGPR